MSAVEYIAGTTLTTAAATVDFTGIPGNYTDLILTCAMGSSGATSGSYVRLNGDTGSNFSSTLLYGTGSAVGSNRQSNMVRAITTNRVPQNALGVVVFQIMSYANTNVFKTWVTLGGDYSQFVECSAALWRSTAAVTSITVTSDAGSNVVAGSTFSLWGVR